MFFIDRHWPRVCGLEDDMVEEEDGLVIPNIEEYLPERPKCNMFNHLLLACVKHAAEKKKKTGHAESIRLY